MTWISVVVLMATIAIMIAGLTNAGVTPGPEMTELPTGVIALFGWANRLLVVLYCLWVATVAKYTLKISDNKESMYELEMKKEILPGQITLSGRNERCFRASNTFERDHTCRAFIAR